MNKRNVFPNVFMCLLGISLIATNVNASSVKGEISFIKKAPSAGLIYFENDESPYSWRRNSY